MVNLVLSRSSSLIRTNSSRIQFNSILRFNSRTFITLNSINSNLTSFNSNNSLNLINQKNNSLNYNSKTNSFNFNRKMSLGSPAKVLDGNAQAA